MGVKLNGKNSRGAGRPPETARDAAVYIARRWRREILRESAKTADEWIIDHWRRCGAPAGLKEQSNVSQKLVKAEKTWLGKSYLLLNDVLRITQDGVAVLDNTISEYDSWQFPDQLREGFELDGCAIAALEIVTDGSSKNQRCWIWMPGLTEAREIPPDRIEFYGEEKSRIIGSDGLLKPYEFRADARPLSQPATAVIGAIGALYGVLRFGRMYRFRPMRHLFGKAKS